MSDTRTHRIVLQPVGAEIVAAHGSPLRDLLFEQGVEFPCGGQGRCRGCKIRVRSGEAALNDAQREHLSAAEIEAGWRLACQCAVEDDLVIELRQWDASILTNESTFAFTPQEGLGVAVDLGTTTLVAQLLDLETGNVLAVRTALNPQARHGADVMSRVQFAMEGGGQQVLQDAIRHEIGVLVRQLVQAAGAASDRLRKVTIVGNTVMHHLFSGVSVEPLSHFPFESPDDGLQILSPQQVGWDLPAAVVIQFLPGLGSFVGSDILAGVLALGMQDSAEVMILVDLGTNGEIVIGNRDRMLCASTAAGPAFEGARIAAGMRASTGAIWKVTADGGQIACEVLGNVPARGVCGSGLVDAVAVGLDTGHILPSGRLAGGATEFALAENVAIHQCDVRQLQLAKGAIAAGIRMLIEHWGTEPSAISRLHLAGAFGNYINRGSARRIGLIQQPLDRVHPVGNTALLGAKLALFNRTDADAAYAGIRARTTHVGLNEDPRFQDVYVDEMAFPVEPPA